MMASILTAGSSESSCSTILGVEDLSRFRAAFSMAYIFAAGFAESNRASVAGGPQPPTPKSVAAKAAGLIIGLSILQRPGRMKGARSEETRAARRGSPDPGWIEVSGAATVRL